MTTTLSARGQIVIPRDIRHELNLRVGDDFIVLSSQAGEILLRPIRKGRRKSLVQVLRAMRGLEIERADEPIREIKL